MIFLNNGLNNDRLDNELELKEWRDVSPIWIKLPAQI